MENVTDVQRRCWILGVTCASLITGALRLMAESSVKENGIIAINI
jgi:hypothetical protein